MYFIKRVIDILKNKDNKNISYEDDFTERINDKILVFSIYTNKATACF